MTTHRRERRHRDGAGVTVDVHDSGKDGPHLLVIGGVHGDEVGGIVAAGRVASHPWDLRSGRLSVIVVAHEAARSADARHSPLDAVNLARAFPGRTDGTPTERLAALLDEIIAEADVLVDLHTSSKAADMPLFVGCVDDGGASSTRSVELALACGLPTIWTHPDVGPGRTLTVAHARHLPALYVESPCGGLLDEGYLRVYDNAVRAVMSALSLIDDDTVAARSPSLWLHGSGDTDTFTSSPRDGFFLRREGLMAEVGRGQPVGAILDEYGSEREIVRAPDDGFITTLQRAAVVATGTPVVGVTGRRPRRLGLASDRLFATSRSTP